MSKVIYKTRIKVNGYSAEYNPIVYTGGELSLHYYSERGRFNFAGSEESTKCHVYLYRDGKRFKSLSIDVEDGAEYSDSDIDEILWLFDEDKKMHWIDTASGNKQALRNFIATHRDKIEYGNAVKEINQLTKDIENKSSRLEYLSKYVRDYSHV